MPSPSSNQSCGPEPLLDICVASLSSNLQHVHSLIGISEELAIVLFQDVLSKARLTPHALRLFEQVQHDSLTTLISKLGITTPPPVLPTSCAGKGRKWF